MWYEILLQNTVILRHYCTLYLTFTHNMAGLFLDPNCRSFETLQQVETELSCCERNFNLIHNLWSSPTIPTQCTLALFLALAPKNWQNCNNRPTNSRCHCFCIHWTLKASCSHNHLKQDLVAGEVPSKKFFLVLWQHKYFFKIIAQPGKTTRLSQFSADQPHFGKKNVGYHFHCTILAHFLYAFYIKNLMPWHCDENHFFRFFLPNLLSCCIPSWKIEIQKFLWIWTQNGIVQVWSESQVRIPLGSGVLEIQRNSGFWYPNAENAHM